MRLIPFELDKQTYHLLFNGAALFDCYDQFGDEGSVLDPINGNTRDAFDSICWYLEELATQGELYRRHAGYDRQAIPSADQFTVFLSPLDVPRARVAIQAAIAAGFEREHSPEEPERVDKSLAMYEKKNGQRFTCAQYLNMASKFLSLSVKEALLLPVGLVLDMVELEIDRRRPKENKDGR